MLELLKDQSSIFQRSTDSKIYPRKQEDRHGKEISQGIILGQKKITHVFGNAGDQ